MQISAYFQQITLGFYYGALKSAVKQMPDQLMPPIKVDRVRSLELMHPLGKIPLRRRRHQVEMIHHENVTMHFYPVALCPFGQIAQKLRPISVIPENLLPSISTRHGVV
jgi:ABC-type siderophore export system fused ATPase/permease subunit